jgi:hypothetical protein
MPLHIYHYTWHHTHNTWHHTHKTSTFTAIKALHANLTYNMNSSSSDNFHVVKITLYEQIPQFCGTENTASLVRVVILTVVLVKIQVFWEMRLRCWASRSEAVTSKCKELLFQ